MKFTIGNKNIEISNDYAFKRNVEEYHWYADVFGTYPTYQCSFVIHKKDDATEDIFNKIYKDLADCGDFTPILYKYSQNNRESDCEGISGDIVEEFVLVSNVFRAMIIYSYNDIVVYSDESTDIVELIIEKYLKKYDQDIEDALGWIICKTELGVCLRNFTIDVSGNIDFDLYNEDFKPIHNNIVKSIKDDKNGLYLLYGKPGTGKSTYIRHLIKELGNNNRKFIYVPSGLFADFTNPAFITFLMDNKGCVFIIEDCENLITVDGGVRSAELTDMLNMTDGILSDALDIKIICTFNIDDGEIDEALMRPGRLRGKYEFNLLKKDRANKAAEKYGIEPVDKDISLAELFNPVVSTVQEEKKKKMGFR